MHSSTNARPKPRSRAHPGPNSNPVGGGAVFPVATSYPSMKAGGSVWRRQDAPSPMPSQFSALKS